MPGKKKGGKRVRRGKKNDEQSKRALDFAGDGQDYALVTKRLGGAYLEVELPDNTTKLAYIRGKFRKRVWINAGDVLIVGMRDFQTDKVDVMHKFNPDEVNRLVKYEEVPAKWVGNTPDEGQDETTLFEYEDAAADKSPQQDITFENSEDDSDLAGKNAEDILDIL